MDGLRTISFCQSTNSEYISLLYSFMPEYTKRFIIINSLTNHLFGQDEYGLSPLLLYYNCIYSTAENENYLEKSQEAIAQAPITNYIAGLC